ncbi:Uncharacterised protein [Catenibacterium mitsuokai]|nr:Uncharacterised protein [Catenibacterium mitsuokai]
MTVMKNSKAKIYHPPFKEDDIKLDLKQVVNWKKCIKNIVCKNILKVYTPRGYFHF